MATASKARPSSAPAARTRRIGVSGPSLDLPPTRVYQGAAAADANGEGGGARARPLSAAPLTAAARDLRLGTRVDRPAKSDYFADGTPCRGRPRVATADERRRAAAAEAGLKKNRARFVGKVRHFRTRPMEERTLELLRHKLLAASYTAHGQDLDGLFLHLDEDASGVLEPVELHSAIRRTLKLGPSDLSDALIAQFFAHLDRDRNGTIEIGEFVFFLSGKERRVRPARHQTAAGEKQRRPQRPGLTAPAARFPSNPRAGLVKERELGGLWAAAHTRRTRIDNAKATGARKFNRLTLLARQSYAGLKALGLRGDVSELRVHLDRAERMLDATEEEMHELGAAKKAEVEKSLLIRSAVLRFDMHALAKVLKVSKQRTKTFGLGDTSDKFRSQPRRRERRPASAW